MKSCTVRLVKYVFPTICMTLFMILYTSHTNVTETQQSSYLQSSEPNETVRSQTVEQPEWIMKNVSCYKLFEGDEEELKKAKRLNKFLPQPPSDEDFKIPTDCAILKSWGYNLKPLSEEERNYPIAITILMHKNIHQFESLLRLIYQPQNVYCVHVDNKSEEVVHDAIKNIHNCLPNVHLAEKLETITYGRFSRLQADINCMSDLVQKDKQWKYLINVASSVLPLRTNAEMVKILKIYNGTNDIAGFGGLWLNKFRRVRKGTMRPKPAPHNIHLLKGSAYAIHSRAFMEWVMTAKEPRDFLAWCKSMDFFSPDEHYWASLHHLKHNPQLNTPGGYKGVVGAKPWIASFSAWPRQHPCKGGWSTHGMCLFGVGDLPYLVTKKALFLNKFDPARDQIAGNCLGELIRNKTRLQGPLLDWYYYSTIAFLGENNK